MKAENDFVEFVELLNKYKVKYIIVGAYALALYAEPRNTGDIDFFVESSFENAEKILKVLKDFGFENLEISLEDLLNPSMVIQLGFAPVRIDILTSISGVEFEEAFTDKVIKKLGGEDAFFISKELLIQNKRASGRNKDLADIEDLINN
ncbi:MAG: nucleotidyltransferase [Bacteroidetes bacterium]|nr:nucleotidyltransferase [Bacteroidota bacterium]MBU1681107.1 nucleotidyltransferase [Bacteroidota bacterium]